MEPATVTSTTLLDGLRREQDSAAWQEFASRYTPMVLAFARRLGLNEHDALDAAQETLMAFVTAYREGRYDRDKGRLRTWLCGIARNKVLMLRRSRPREALCQDATGKTAFLDRAADDDPGLERIWEEEWQRAVLSACLDRVRALVEPTTMEAFTLTVLQGHPTEDVAARLNLSSNAVLQAKSRVLGRLRQIQSEFEVIW